MTTCKQCREFEKCKDDAFINGSKFDPNESAKYCTGFEPMTNADRIRAMSDEELADVLTNHSNNVGWVTETGREICYERILKWLQQPAEGE